MFWCLATVLFQPPALFPMFGRGLGSYLKQYSTIQCSKASTKPVQPCVPSPRCVHYPVMAASVVSLIQHVRLLLLQANVGPWVRLAEETGALIKWWRVKEDPPFPTSMDDLHQLLTDKTKIVALPHVSNLLGEVLDIAAVVRAVRDGPAGPSTSAA